MLVAGRLFGAALFGAFAIAVAVVELAVTVGGAGMKRQIFKLLDEEQAGRERAAHVWSTASCWSPLASLACAAPIMLAVALLPAPLVADNTGAALLLLAPMILGQALLDLLLAATRWTHKMRHQVWARSIIEPYAGVAAAALAWWAGFEATGLVIGYWAGRWRPSSIRFAAARACLGPFRLRAWRLHSGPAQGRWSAQTCAADDERLRQRAGRPARSLPGRPVPRRGAGRHLRHGAPGPHADPAGAAELRRPVDPDRLAHPHARPARPGPARATASASRLILAIQLPILIALFVLGLPLLHWIGPEFAAGYWAMLMLAAAESIQGAFGVSDLIFLYRRPAALLWVTATWIAVNFAAGWLLIPS